MGHRLNALLYSLGKIVLATHAEGGSHFVQYKVGRRLVFVLNVAGKLLHKFFQIEDEATQKAIGKTLITYRI